MEHILATSIYHGSANVEAFNSKTLNNSKIKDLREKITMYLYNPEPEPPNNRPAEVTILLSDGKKYIQECLIAEGSASKPFTNQRIQQKISTSLKHHYPKLHAPLQSIIAMEERTLNTKWRDILKK